MDPRQIPAGMTIFPDRLGFHQLFDNRTRVLYNTRRRRSSA